MPHTNGSFIGMCPSPLSIEWRPCGGLRLHTDTIIVLLLIVKINLFIYLRHQRIPDSWLSLYYCCYLPTRGQQATSATVNIWHTYVPTLQHRTITIHHDVWHYLLVIRITDCLRTSIKWLRLLPTNTLESKQEAGNSLGCHADSERVSVKQGTKDVVNKK